MHRYVQLNDTWNADPNVPDPRLVSRGDGLLLTFYVNAFQFPQFVEGQQATLRFTGCTRYRLGAPNDEGWYRGDHGFAVAPPPWGEFYELVGEPLRSVEPNDWIVTSTSSTDSATRHFLFYFRDETFECEAINWRFDPQPLPDAS